MEYSSLWQRLNSFDKLKVNENWDFAHILLWRITNNLTKIVNKDHTFSGYGLIFVMISLIIFFFSKPSFWAVIIYMSRKNLRKPYSSHLEYNHFNTYNVLEVECLCQEEPHHVHRYQLYIYTGLYPSSHFRYHHYLLKTRVIHKTTKDFKGTVSLISKIGKSVSD